MHTSDPTLIQAEQRRETPETASSPYLNRRLRSEQEVAQARDDATIAGLLIALDGVMMAAAKQQARCATERGRICCSKVIEHVAVMRRQIEIVEIAL